MGASGSGKSTLLQICGAMLEADSGDCQLLHYQLRSASEDVLTAIRRQHIGFVFQGTHLLPTLTIRENIELPLRLLKSPPKTTKLKAEQLAERVGIKDRLDHFPDEVSGGEAQRAAIARAVIHSPEILIADEPTGSLDSENGLNVLELLTQLNRELNLTILLATHDPKIAQFAKKILYMKDGHFINH
jgi:putative ABC transport system ATP-binding protein